MKRLNDSSDFSEASLGILLKNIYKHKEKMHSAFPRRNGYSRLRQQKSRRIVCSCFRSEYAYDQ